MSAAAVTISPTNNVGNFPQNWVPSPAGGPVLKVWDGSITGGNSYTTGGFVLAASLFGMTQILSFVSCSASNSNLTVNNAGKLQFFVATTGAEVASTTDLSAVTVEIHVVGI
ncbi:MAG: hypothetical protein ACREQ5_03740 [Candidatus Dormibacteria bacterium]